MPRPSSSFETRAGAFEFVKRLGIRAPQDEDEHRVLQSSPYKQPFSFPRRFRRRTRWLVRSLYFPVFLQIRNLPSPVSRSRAHTPPPSRGAFLRPGFCIVASLTPNRGVGGAPRNVRVLRHPLGVSCASKTRVNALMTRYARRLARRLASHNAGRSPLGAPPGGFSPGAALPSPSAPAVLQRRAVAFRIRAASSSQPGRSAWRAGSRASRGQRLQAAAAGRHSPLRLQDVSGDAPQRARMRIL